MFSSRSTTGPYRRTGMVGVFALIAIASLARTLAQVPGPVTPARRADHVFVLMLDGARPDILRTVNAATIRALEASGVRYAQARTIYPSQTRVAFVSLPTGAYPGSHGVVGGPSFKDDGWATISYRDDDPSAAQALCARPTIFEELAAAGLTSAYAAMKGYELVGARGATWTINGNRTLDRDAYATRYQAEAQGSAALGLWNKQRLARDLLDQTVVLVKEHRPNLVILNLGSADYSAHSYGPETPQYRQTLEHIDGLIADLLRVLEQLKMRDRTTIIVSADHGFSTVDRTHIIAKPVGETVVIESLSRLGIEHQVSNTGGTSMGIYIRDKNRAAEAARALRREPWCEAIYCEDASAQCDKTLRELHAYFPGRSPDLMVDIDDDATATQPYAGNHGSLRDSDMRIPLILSGAGVAKGLVFGKASLVDVAPTIVRLFGLPGSMLRPDGRALEEALEK
jgi:phosphonoacetate hydrolase